MTLIDELVAKHGARAALSVERMDGNISHAASDEISQELRSALEEMLEKCAAVADSARYCCECGERELCPACGDKAILQRQASVEAIRKLGAL